MTDMCINCKHCNIEENEETGQDIFWCNIHSEGKKLCDDYKEESVIYIGRFDKIEAHT